MGADTAISAESGLPRRRAVAFIILLGTISLFADMTYEGAEHHRPLSRCPRSHRDDDRRRVRLWRARRLRRPPRLGISRRSQRSVLDRHDLRLSLKPPRRAASGTRRKLADCGRSDHRRSDGTGGPLAAARRDAVACRRPDRARLWPSPGRSTRPARSPALETAGLAPTFRVYLAVVAFIAAGYTYFALIAYHFGTAAVMPTTWIPIVLGMVRWGIGTGAQESVMRATIAQLAPRERRATAFGIFNAVYGVAWFAGSVLLGILYDLSVASVVIASTALQAAALPVLYWLAHRRARSLA